MPELTLATQDARKAQALAIWLDLQSEDITLAVACERHGMSEKAYRHWMNTSEDLREAVREFSDEMQKMMLVDLEIAFPKAVSQLMRLATHQATNPKMKLQITKYLQQLREELERVYHAQPGREDEAHEFLKQGPMIAQGKSRMASIEVEPTSDGRISINVSRYHDVIDLEASEPSDPSSSDH